MDEIEGRILVEDLFATMNQPPFNRSPLDGYALGSKDIVGASRENPLSLKVIDTIYAGGYSSAKWEAGKTNAVND